MSPRLANMIPMSDKESIPKKKKVNRYTMVIAAARYFSGVLRADMKESAVEINCKN